MVPLCEMVGGSHIALMKKSLSFLLLLCLGVAQAETVWLDGVDQYSGWTDYNKSNPKAEDGDNNLCWAASASNVINWWQKRYVTPSAAPTGEAIWSTFKASTSGDVGGNTIGAMQWWLTGWYSYDGSPDAEFYAGWAMEDESIINKTINKDTYFEGYYRYLEGNLESVYENKWVDHLQRFMNDLDAGVNVDNKREGYTGLSYTLKEAISGGAGVSVSLKTDIGGHAVTLWGAEFNEDGNLIGMWLTDSDDNQYGKHEDSGIFYAALGESTLTMTTTFGDGTSVTKEYYQVTTESGWYGQDTYLTGFTFFNTAVSDTWGMMLAPEPATATLGLLALVGLAARRRRC